MLFGKKKEQKSKQVANRSKNTPVAQNPSEPKQKSTRQKIIELEQMLDESMRPIEHSSADMFATEDSEIRAMMKEVRKAYGLWYLYVRKYQHCFNDYFGSDNLTLDEMINKMDSLIQNTVYHFLYYSIGVRYRNGEMLDDEGFAYIPIRKLEMHLDEDGKNRIVPALKKLGVVYDEFLTEFDYDAAKDFFNEVARCRFTGTYPVLKCNLHNCWYASEAYDATGLAYWIKVILNNLHKPDRNYIFSVDGIHIGVVCLGTESQMEFDVGYSTSSSNCDGLPVKDPHFYSDPVHITLNTENDTYVSLAQKVIDDMRDELENFEFEDDDSKYADEYR